MRLLAKGWTVAAARREVGLALPQKDDISIQELELLQADSERLVLVDLYISLRCRPIGRQVLPVSAVHVLDDAISSADRAVKAARRRIANEADLERSGQSRGLR